MRIAPGLAGGIGPQLLHGHQDRASVSLGKGRPLAQELWETLGLTQVDLQRWVGAFQEFTVDISTFISSEVDPEGISTDLSKLPLPQLLPEDQLLPRELGGGDVLPGEGVHGEGGNGVHVAASDALQPHDVRLCVVRRAAVETLVRRALGDVGLGVASTAGCWRGGACLLQKTDDY